MKILAAFLITVCAVFFVGCAGLEHKTVANNTSADGIKVESTGSATTGTLLPNLWLGAIINQFATVPVLSATDADGKPNISQFLYMHTIRNSFLGSVFGINDATESIIYIGAVGESAEDTIKRVNALNSLRTPATTSNTSTTSDVK